MTLGGENFSPEETRKMHITDNFFAFIEAIIHPNNLIYHGGQDDTPYVYECRTEEKLPPAQE